MASPGMTTVLMLTPPAGLGEIAVATERTQLTMPALIGVTKSVLFSVDTSDSS